MARGSSRKSDLEAAFARGLDMFGEDLPRVREQYECVPGRKFTADFAFPEQRLAVWVEGGVFTGQAHGSVSGILKDIERANAYAIAGWRVMRFSAKDLTARTAAESYGLLEHAVEKVRCALMNSNAR